MKVLVAYMSQTGNAKKVAEAISQEVQVGKEIRPLLWSRSTLVPHSPAFTEKRQPRFRGQ